MNIKSGTDPPGEQNQEAPHYIGSGIQYYFQIFTDFIQLNFAETPVWGV